MWKAGMFVWQVGVCVAVRCVFDCSDEGMLRVDCLTAPQNGFHSIMWNVIMLCYDYLAAMNERL